MTRIVKLWMAALFWSVRSAVAAVLRATGRPGPPTVVVLMYHAVKPAERARFAQQMDVLCRMATPVRGDCSRAELTPGRHHVIVTFDDAYASIVPNALAVLSMRGIPATVFAPTRYLGGTPDWITNPSSPDRDEMVLSGEELKGLRKTGVLIGSHSVNHRPLDVLSPAEIAAELIDSRRALEDLLDEPITLFALPYGAGTPEVLELARHAGYRRVFLGDPVWLDWEPEMIAIGRIGVTPHDWPLEYRLKVTGAYQWLPLAIAAKRQVRRVLRRLPLARMFAVGNRAVVPR